MDGKLIRLILVAMFAALIAAGAFIRIPMAPVPVTLQTLFVLVCALLMPPLLSLSAVLVYLLLGIAGLPVFTAGGGIAAIAGPTGGYLIGLVPAVLAAGLFYRKDGIAWYALAALLATVMIYIPGLLVLKHARELTWKATVSGGLLPFIPGDTLKIVVSVITAKAVKPRVRGMLEKDK